MTDLSKIDFSRLTLPEWSGDRVVCKWSHTAGSLLVKRNGFDFASLSPGRPWVYDRGPWSLLEVAKTYTDRVDAFIAEESARLAAKDEAANWVPVPWQDAVWLRENGCDVIVWRGPGNEHLKRAITSDDSGLATPSSGPFLEYHADRSTFPAGYDPTKPRLVEVGWDQVARLECAGCDSFGARGEAAFAKRYVRGAGDQACRYAIDIHTLKPGVPLHEKPPSGIIAGLRWTAARARTEISSWPQWQQDAVKAAHDQAVTSQPPKPATRPCTREFPIGLSHAYNWFVR